MFGTREELCVQLENMFTFDEPLILLVWTEEGVSVACRERGQHPDEKEVWSLMKAIGDMPMAEYRRERFLREPRIQRQRFPGAGLAGTGGRLLLRWVGISA